MAHRRSRRARDTLCIAPDNFVIAAARQCRAGQTRRPLPKINPTPTDDRNLVAYLAEDSEYDDEQARLAGIQGYWWSRATTQRDRWRRWSEDAGALAAFLKTAADAGYRAGG